MTLCADRVGGLLLLLLLFAVLLLFPAPIFAEVLPSLGRPLSGGAANVTVNLVAPGTMYGDRLEQLDMRFTKIVRFGRTRADVGVDVQNLFNANYATSWDNTYQYGAANGGTWNNPTAVYTPRFVRWNLTVDF